MTMLVGGPGPRCSETRVRRLAAGELEGEERLRTEAHVAGCARCRRTEEVLAAERARLAADLPFDAFAAGIAERLARAPPRPARPRGGWRAALGVAVAAVLVAAIAIPVVRERGGGPEERAKGAPVLDVWVRERGAAEPRLLARGEPVPVGASLRVGLSPAGRRFAAVALVDADGVVVLHAGPAQAGALPGAFEWTGRGEGALVLVLDDAPVDAGGLADRLRRGGIAAAAGGGASVVLIRPLSRPLP